MAFNIPKEEQLPKESHLPDKYVHIYARYGAHCEEEYDTLEEAIEAAGMGNDNGEIFPISVCKDGEIVLENDALLEAGWQAVKRIMDAWRAGD